LNSFFKDLNSVRDTITFSMKYSFLEDIQCSEDDPHPVKLPDSQVPSSTKKKRKKDKNAPRKPNTAYTCFQKIFYKEMKAENPDVSFAEISKLVGAKWKNTSEEEKKEFEKQSEEDKVRYNNEMANYIAPPPSDEDEPEGKKKKRDPNKPKHPKSAYLFFCDEMRKEIKAETPDITFSNSGKELGKRYAELSAEERKKYDDLSTEDKLRYGEEMAVYRSGGKLNGVQVGNEKEKEESQNGEGEKAEVETKAESKAESESEEGNVESESDVEVDSDADTSSQEKLQSPVRTRNTRRNTIQSPPQEKKQSRPKMQSTKKKKRKQTKSGVGKYDSYQNYDI